MMVGKVLRGAHPRRGLGLLFALCAFSSLRTASSSVAKVSVPGYRNAGLRWIGLAPACTAPTGWVAERLFHAPALPAALGELCVYDWVPSGGATEPTALQVSVLFTGSRARELTEDVPVVYPSAPSAAFPPSPEETALFAGLRSALRAQVGDVSLLPGPVMSPTVRVVVIDSAPDHPAGQLALGLSRHGDTLAYLIEDLVCRPSDDGAGRVCAAEVSTELALQWVSRGVPGTPGGYLGTLSDLARAIERAVSTWQFDRSHAPMTTPMHLLLNLSLGWEHTGGIADCSTANPAQLGPPARAVRGILQYAASQGAMIVAAAGNDSGGPVPRPGLTCPGLYQAVPRDADPTQSLVVAVSAVDYQDHPLETARPSGHTGIVGLGLGGVAWSAGDPVPPALTGSSVSTAVVSAISALVWTVQPTWTPDAVTAAVYRGGVDLAAQADDCPLSIGPCRSHRASMCGALTAAGVSSLTCGSPAPKPWSSPALPAEVAALAAAYQTTQSIPGILVADPVPRAAIPRYQFPTVQVQPSTFPTPLSETCPTCVVMAGQSSSLHALLVPARTQVLLSPMLVVELAGSGGLKAMKLDPQALPAGPARVYSLPPNWIVRSAYLTGLEAPGRSITEQLVVAQ
jgi:subtilase family protein